MDHRQPETDENMTSMGTETAVIRLEQVVKRYDHLTVLDGISFAVKAGEAIALWGANGAGKTTLLKALLGLIDYQGQIWVHGFEVRKADKQVRRQLGYVPQEAVYYDMSVQATMEFYAGIKKVPLSQIEPLLQQLGLVEHLKKAVPALSGGLKQRLALAIALLGDAPILLLDEPTANLDHHARREYLELLAQLRTQGKTLVFASHRLEEVEGLADRLLVLQEGKIRQEVPAADLRLWLAPEALLTIWLPAAQHAVALAILQQAGMTAHLNGRGTLVVQVAAHQKLEPLRILDQNRIEILDFQIDAVNSWI